MRKRLAAAVMAVILGSLFLGIAPVAASDYSLTILSVDKSGQLSPDRTLLTVSGSYVCTASDPAPIDRVFSQIWGAVTQGSASQISDEDFIPTCDQGTHAFALRFTRAAGWANGGATAVVGGTLCSTGCAMSFEAAWYTQQLQISAAPGAPAQLSQSDTAYQLAVGAACLRDLAAGAAAGSYGILAVLVGDPSCAGTLLHGTMQGVAVVQQCLLRNPPNPACRELIRLQVSTH
jgi:hypothetical protein